MARDEPNLLEPERIALPRPACLTRAARLTRPTRAALMTSWSRRPRRPRRSCRSRRAPPLPRLAYLTPGRAAPRDPSRDRPSRPPPVYARPRRRTPAGSVTAAAHSHNRLPPLIPPIAIRRRVGRISVALETFTAVIAVAARVAVAETAAMAGVAPRRRHLGGAAVPLSIHSRRRRGTLAAIRITDPQTPSGLPAPVAIVGANARGALAA